MTSTQSRNRIGAFGTTTGASHGDHGRSGNRALGTALGNGTNTWAGGGSSSIWGSNTYGNVSKNGKHDSNQVQSEPFGGGSNRDMTSGSGSLLSSSELDNANAHQIQWRARDEASDFPLMSRTGTSPDLRQASSTYAQTGLPDSAANAESLFPFSHSPSSMTARPSQKISLDPTSRDFVASDIARVDQFQSSRNNSEEENLYSSARRGVFGRAESGFSQADRLSRGVSLSGYNSSGGSRNGSLPPSRGDFDPPLRNHGDVSNLHVNRFGANINAQRLNSASNAASAAMHTGPSNQMLKEQHSSSRLDNLSSHLDNLSLQNQPRRPSYASSQHSPNGTSDPFPTIRAPQRSGLSHNQWTREDYIHANDQLSPTGSSSGFPRQSYRRPGIEGQFSQSPGDSDSRPSHHSPYYSSAGTPPINQHKNLPRGSHAPGTLPQPTILDERLRSLQQQQSYQTQSSSLPLRNPVNMSFDVGAQQSFAMNPLASYYPMQPAPHLLASAQVPRGPARDQDPAGHLRSPLLEDYRNNSKTNKRYDLKDIYEHIVEFSGDQHGSRFIQQKLETANSDEKDQVFRELLPNAFQLMTDVFGNYVIQKFFEHGNQPQKKTLANQMKNRVFALSTQMYGCRVVQKALEHVLTDQQAQLISELDQDVMACVRDQNGNHVVQKAIERIPAEHIQFIVNAFQGEVCKNATHPYGCRVIQRMLEHCEEPTRLAILQELHSCASTLISDQYGNYVTQHLIQHGRPEDRRKIINLVISNLVKFSKHKFASNVVEKSIEFGALEERLQIVQKLTMTNERGESPVQTLIRDQYGNYVVQKLLTRLQGQEWSNFVEPVKLQVALLKRFAYGKQVASVERLLFRGQLPAHIQNDGIITPSVESALATPPLTTDNSHSPQSSSQPSTHHNSLEGPYESQKPSGDVVSIFQNIAI